MGNFNLVCSLSSPRLVQGFVLISCWLFANTVSCNQHVWLFPLVMTRDLSFQPDKNTLHRFPSSELQFMYTSFFCNRHFLLIRNNLVSINFGLKAMIKETKLLSLGIAVTDGPGTYGQNIVPEMGFLQLQRVQPPGAMPGTREEGGSGQHRELGAQCPQLNSAQ